MPDDRNEIERYDGVFFFFFVLIISVLNSIFLVIFTQEAPSPRLNFIKNRGHRSLNILGTACTTCRNTPRFKYNIQTFCSRMPVFLLFYIIINACLYRSAI